MSFITLILSVIFFVGTSSCFPEGRVVNGTYTDVIKYPFIASLRFLDSHVCGCSIIAPRWILTAATCVFQYPTDIYTVQYATTKINTFGSNVARVKRIITHEDFAPSRRFANNIALLELEGSLIYNYKTLAAVTLPEPYFEIPQTQSGAQGDLVGYGSNGVGFNLTHHPLHLQEVHLKIYSDAECNLRHSGNTTNDHICGGVDEGGRGQCTGDAGGPLLYNGSVQLGIASWSKKPCAVPPYPGVYTKVSHYIHWINKNIK